jgi:hypothetical protein
LDKEVWIFFNDETELDFDTPPSDTLWTKASVRWKGGTRRFNLIDEFLMWAHDAASPDPTGERMDRGPVWYDRLKNFFQKLGQAVNLPSGPVWWYRCWQRNPQRVMKLERQSSPLVITD